MRSSSSFSASFSDLRLEISREVCINSISRATTHCCCLLRVRIGRESVQPEKENDDGQRTLGSRSLALSIGTDLVLVHLGSRLDRLCTIGELHAQNRCRKRPNQCGEESRLTFDPKHQHHMNSNRNAQLETYRDLAWCESVRPSKLDEPAASRGSPPSCPWQEISPRSSQSSRSLQATPSNTREQVCQMHRFAFLAFKRLVSQSMRYNRKHCHACHSKANRSRASKRPGSCRYQRARTAVVLGMHA
jgi:hypothetical protein